MSSPVHRRDFLKGAASSVAAPSLAAGLQSSQSGPRPPNILYLHSHDTGRYIQPFGHGISTPNLQTLAAEGVLFRRCFSAAPTCSPSRAALLTGQAPHTCGEFGLVNFGFSLAHPERHIARVLKPAGYYTAAAGIQHILKNTLDAGYDEVVHSGPALENGWAAVLEPEVVKFLSRPPKQPFFMAAGFVERHRPYHPHGPADDPRYTIPPAPIPDTPDTRLDMANFKNTARVLDTAIGNILGALERKGLAGNTLVIYSTDHGVAFPDMKCSLQDAGMGVSLIVRGPGGFSGDKVIDALVSHLDIYPTLCDVAKAGRPSWLQGHSMLPLVNGETNKIRGEVFAEVTYHIAYEPKRCIRTGRYKYIRHFLDRDRPVIANCDDSPSKQYWLKEGWQQQHADREEFFDLVFDPHEMRNLIADPSVHSIAEDLRSRLDRWMKDTGDPILNGPIQAPSGARVWGPDASFPGPGFVTIP
ncbi:MAG: sulfatase family protein [Bryobacteraceae bacterium]